MKLKDEVKLEETTTKGEEVVTKKKTKKIELELKEENLEELIIEWKKSFSSLYKTTVDGNTIIFKPVGRKEYREIIKKKDETPDASNEDKRWIREEETILRSCLYPSKEALKALIEEKAGFSLVVSEEILGKSGFDITEAVAL